MLHGIAIAPSTAAPLQTLRTVGFARLGRSALSSLRYAGIPLENGLFPPESCLFPLEFRWKTGRCGSYCGAVAANCTLMGQAKGDVRRRHGGGAPGARQRGRHRRHRRGGGDSLGPFRPKPLVCSRAENFPHFKRNSNGRRSRQGCRPHQCWLCAAAKSNARHFFRRRWRSTIKLHAGQ